MNARKIKLLLVFLFSLVFLCGCSTDGGEGSMIGSELTSDVEVVSEEFDENGSGTLNCVTEAFAEEGVDVDLSYVVDYKRGNILKLRSIAKITSSDQTSLDEYEMAYQKIADDYDGLEYYDIRLVRDSNTVTYDTTINYDKIDVETLLDIEGEEDNIIQGGKAKLSLWLDLAGSVGTTCEEV